jgi:hypothetical protein
VFLLPRESRFDRFSGLHTRGTHELSGQIGVLSTQWIVGCFVQLYPVATSRLVSLTADGIEALSVLLHRAIKDSPLLRGRIQLYHNCSVHARTISYIQTSVNTLAIFAPAGAFLTSPWLKRGVSRKDF